MNGDSQRETESFVTRINLNDIVPENLVFFCSWSRNYVQVLNTLTSMSILRHSTYVSIWSRESHTML